MAGRVDRHKIPAEAVMARNETSRVLHISKEEQATSFICGRKITSAYEVCDAHPPVFLFPRCRQCFRNFLE